MKHKVKIPSGTKAKAWVGVWRDNSLGWYGVGHIYKGATACVDRRMRGKSHLTRQTGVSV